MPERPDLEYVVPILARELSGKRIDGVEVHKPVVLRVLLRDRFEDLVTGAVIESVTRRAHFVLFALAAKQPLEMPIAPMLAGRFSIDGPKAKAPADRAITFTLEDGRLLRYRDDVQMGKVFVVARGEWKNVPGLSKVGVDVLDENTFTPEAFRALVRTRRDQAKVFLMDKTALDSMGNAYADEVLFAAKVHPKAMVRSLPDDAVLRLHRAIVDVLGRARDEIQRREPALHEKLRDFLNVRGRAGDPCPICGTKIRRAGVRGHDAYFCPTCQPDKRQSSIVDWSKLPQGAGPAEGLKPQKRRKR